MKPIKIFTGNASQIKAALAAANGKSIAHTFTDLRDVYCAADVAEAQLIKLVSKKLASGAVYTSQSGDKLPNAYQNSRKVTTIRIERRSNDWWLVAVVCHDAYKEAGKSRLTLTQTQRDFAVSRFCAQFGVAASVAN
jgi:hypothetical protein